MYLNVTLVEHIDCCWKCCEFV